MLRNVCEELSGIRRELQAIRMNMEKKEPTVDAKTVIKAINEETMRTGKCQIKI